MWEMMENQGEGSQGFQGYVEEIDQCNSNNNYNKLGFDQDLMFAPHPNMESWPLITPVNPAAAVNSEYMYNPRPPPSTAVQFAYNSSVDPLSLAGLYSMGASGGLTSSSSTSSFAGLHTEFSRMTAKEIMDAKALAASKSHSEAERRRRERINGHLAKLRSLLPSTTKTDKASLLAEVIEHVKELKRQTSVIAEGIGPSLLPTESDELTVDRAGDGSEDGGRLVVRASMCCEDRSDLIPDLIRSLKALRLRTLKAEITTLGGRVKNVLLIAGDEIDGQQHSLASIQDALKAVIERSSVDDGGITGGTKRQRTNHLSII